MRKRLERVWNAIRQVLAVRGLLQWLGFWNHIPLMLTAIASVALGWWAYVRGLSGPNVVFLALVGFFLLTFIGAIVLNLVSPRPSTKDGSDVDSPPVTAPAAPTLREQQPDVALIWDWSNEQKLAAAQLSLADSSKGIIIHNRHEKWVYNLQLDPIQLSQTLTFEPITEIGPNRWQLAIGRWNGRSSVTTEYVYFFTNDDNENVATSKGWKRPKSHKRGLSSYFLSIPMRLRFQTNEGSWERTFSLIYDQNGETRFERE